MRQFLPFIQIGISILLVAGILLQQRGGGLSPILGGEGGIYRTRRGVEKIIYRTTTVLAVLFFITAVLGIIVR